MRSNDTILLEKAYEQIFKKQFLNEEHDGFEFKGAGSYMEDVLGKDIYNLPRQNFYDAIESGNLKEGAWYIHVRKEGYNPALYKIVGISDGKITVEDSYMKLKEIEASEEDNDTRRGMKYRIFDPRKEDKSFRFGLDIIPSDLLIGPVEDEEVINNIEKHITELVKRSESMDAYFRSHPDAPLD